MFEANQSNMSAGDLSKLRNDIQKPSYFRRSISFGGKKGANNNVMEIISRSISAKSAAEFPAHMEGKLYTHRMAYITGSS